MAATPKPNRKLYKKSISHHKKIAVKQGRSKKEAKEYAEFYSSPIKNKKIKFKGEFGKKGHF